MTKRDEQREQRKRDILFAGLSLFIRKGYTGTKIKDIANAVDMSAGLLFHYFASKEELYIALVKLGIEGPMKSVQVKGFKPLAFFETTAKNVLSSIQNEPFVANMFVFMSQAYSSDDVPESVKTLLADFDVFSPTAGIIEQGQSDGSIRQGNPMALAIAFWGAVQGVAGTLALNPGSPCPSSGWIVDIIRNQIGTN